MQRLLACLVFLEAVGCDEFTYLALVVGGQGGLMSRPFHIILVNQGKVRSVLYDVLVTGCHISKRLASFTAVFLNVKVALNHHRALQSVIVIRRGILVSGGSPSQHSIPTVLNFSSSSSVLPIQVYVCGVLLAIQVMTNHEITTTGSRSTTSCRVWKSALLLNQIDLLGGSEVEY